jgi:two-component system, sensor histidine kinase and response regulator
MSLLVVDDEVAQMQALCATLEIEGYRTTGYSSPHEALDNLRPGQHELLLTDLMMPELDGIELIKAARAIDPDIAGVVMTGHGTIDTAVAAMQVGALDYVLKPFKLNAILTVIGRALDVRRLRLENAALQRREREQAAELAAAYRDLESFSYSVSHDLRSPLRAIRGFTDLYLSEFGQGIPEEGRRRLNQVIAGAERMDQLIEDLLKFCRFSRAPLHRRPVDLNAIVQRVLADLRAREPERAIEVRAEELPGCEGDPSLLEQVVVNLLSNAFKFTRKVANARIEIGTIVQQVAPDAGSSHGSGPAAGPAEMTSGPAAVAADSAPTALGVTTPRAREARASDVASSTHRGTELVYFVRDNGAGFDMKYADNLFGVFQRLHSREQFEGTGVGLSIVQRVLQRHGGRIWAESAPGRGATFFFVV